VSLRLYPLLQRSNQAHLVAQCNHQEYRKVEQRHLSLLQNLAILLRVAQ